MSNYHVSVLLQEAVTALKIQPGKKYIDATLGAGGHSLEIVKHGGIVLGIDQDEEAIVEVKKILSNKDIKILSAEKESPNILISQYPNITLAQGNFSSLEKIAKDNGFEHVAGILFDIGVSSHQLDTNKRGFSFMSTGPLDMRMDKSLGVSAADLVNGLTKGELIELFTKYGEEPYSKRIAEAIVGARLTNPIQTTTELAEIIARSVPRNGKIHPATKVFQALRIAVNDELNNLEQGLSQAVDLLSTNGRLVVITFHSLEDRIVKKIFEQLEEKSVGEILTDKPILPSDEEIIANRRARSAKMRVFKKI